MAQACLSLPMSSPKNGAYDSMARLKSSFNQGPYKSMNQSSPCRRPRTKSYLGVLPDAQAPPSLTNLVIASLHARSL